MDNAHTHNHFVPCAPPAERLTAAAELRRKGILSRPGTLRSQPQRCLISRTRFTPATFDRGCFRQLQPLVRPQLLRTENKQHFHGAVSDLEHIAGIAILESWTKAKFRTDHKPIKSGRFKSKSEC